MIDWTKSMQQTFEYYVVDPHTWGDVSAVQDVRKCKITRDLDDETLGSSSLDCDTDLTDKYVRSYLVVTQGIERAKFCLGTHLYQTPSITFDGKKQTMSQDGYTPLIELKEKVMTPGYAVRTTAPIATAGRILRESVRAPIIDPDEGSVIPSGDETFMSEMSDTRLSFLTDLLALVNYRFGLDEIGRIMFEPNQELAAMKPIYEYNDDNSSILSPAITIQRDLYGVPNVVEVIYSPSDGTYLYSAVENVDPDSIVSIKSRGREVWHRDTDPNVVTGISQVQLDAYAKNLLRDLSSIEYTITYTHGYCGVRVGDCVRLNYSRADLLGVNAKVIKQVISCESGCQVEETAVFNRSLINADMIKKRTT